MVEEIYSEYEFKKLFHRLPDLIFQFTRRPNGSYFVPIASKGIENIFGCSPTDVLDNFEPILKAIHPEDSKKVIKQIERSAKKIEEFTSEFRVIIQGKPIQWIQMRSIPEKYSDGTVTWYGINTNITNQKNALEEIIAFSKKQEALIKAIPDIIFEVGINGKIHKYHSPSSELLVLFPKAFIGRRITDLIPNNAAVIISSAIKECNKKQESIGYELELELNGKKNCFEFSVNKIDNVSNNENHFILLFKNVTEKRQKENQLQQLSQAVEQSSSSIMITDLEGKLQYVNQHFLTITGYKQEEIIGQNPKLLQSGFTKNAVYMNMWQTIIAGETWHGELLNKKKNGEYFWEDVSISPIRGKNSKITHFLAIATDITYTKKTEESFRKIARDQSHQVRGPLTSILGLINLIKMDIPIEEKISLIIDLENAAKQLDIAIHKIVDETQRNKTPSR